MRSRSRVLAPTSAERVYTDVTVGSLSDSSEGPYVTSFEDESMTDVVTPSFAKKQRNGVIIENPCTYRRSALTSSGLGSATYTLRDISGTVVYSATGTGPLTARILQIFGWEPPLSLEEISPGTQLDNLIQESRLEALANIDPSALETGEDIAELGETLRFLKSPLRSIFQALSRRGVRSAADLSADVWLSLRFGITPMVISIDNLLREYSNRTPRPSRLLTSRGFASHEAFTGGNRPFGPTGDRSNVEWGSHCNIAVKSTIHYQVRNPSYNWQWRYGLRNKDILPTFWAVMPLSFMVDRIIDISSMVKSVQNYLDPSVQILGASTTIRSDCTSTCYVSSFSTTNTRATYFGSGENRHRKVFSYRRIPYSPSMSDTLPPFDKGGLVRDLTSIADLAALIYSRLRK